MQMLDVFSGSGSIAAAFRRLGWETTTIDLHTEADVQADALTWHPPKADFVWASPPCEEFSAAFMPWNPNFRRTPSLELVQAARRIIVEAAPRHWVIENVKGASSHLRPILGIPDVIGPLFLWHNLPTAIVARHVFWKERLPGRRRTDRSTIPATIADSIARHVTEAMNTLTLA